MMGFFDTLRRVLGQGPSAEKVSAAWGMDDAARAVPTSPAAHDTDSGQYDRAQWQKKMKRILDELPDSRHEWDELMADARALNFETEWVTRSQVDEFLLMVRRAVSDRHFTEEEHRKLDLARDLIGIPEAEAEAALNSIVAEAESFFGKAVEGA
jgi:hypothetical protein